MTERELSRQAARRLSIIRHAEEVTGNVAMTCRYFGITRHTYYRWFRRYQQLGVDGLRDRAASPRSQTSAMPFKLKRPRRSRSAAHLGA